VESTGFTAAGFWAASPLADPRNTSTASV
jgi:hypothetical protein